MCITGGSQSSHGINAAGLKSVEFKSASGQIPQGFISPLFPKPSTWDPDILSSYLNGKVIKCVCAGQRSNLSWCGWRGKAKV